MNFKFEEIKECPLCGSRKYSKILTKFSLSIVRCAECSLIYTNPRLPVEEIFKRYSSCYFFREYLPALESSLKGDDLTPLRDQYRLFLQIIERFYSPGKRLLEIGCGAGYFLHFAREMGWKVEGVEYIPEAAQYAELKFGITIRKGRFEDLSFQDYFDLVVLLDTLEHFPYLSACLRKIHDLLKPDGILILSTPDYQSLSRFIWRKDWAVLSPADHLFYFTRRTLSLLLHKSGFEILGMESFADFHPGCTHAPTKIRFLAFNYLINRIAKSFFLNKIREKEFNELIRADDFSTGAINLYPFFIRVKKQIINWGYRLVKKVVHGDRLIAIAQKFPVRPWEVFQDET